MPQLALSICPVCLGLVRSFLFLCVLSHLVSPLMRVWGGFRGEDLSKASSVVPEFQSVVRGQGGVWLHLSIRVYI